jgi:hypothetical protein
MILSLSVIDILVASKAPIGELEGLSVERPQGLMAREALGRLPDDSLRAHKFWGPSRCSRRSHVPAK